MGKLKNTHGVHVCINMLYITLLENSVCAVLQPTTCGECMHVHLYKATEKCKMCGTLFQPIQFTPITKRQVFEKWMLWMGLAWSIPWMSKAKYPTTHEIIKIMNVYYMLSGHLNLSMCYTLYKEYKRSAISIGSFVDLMVAHPGCVWSMSDTMREELARLGREATKGIMNEEWEMDNAEYTSAVQWLPRELIEDTLTCL